jgi:hypothetical protein
VSSVPAEIAGIGPTSLRLRVSPGFDPLKAQVGPDEYFVLSRIDGQQTLREVLLATGLPVERCIAIVSRLRSIGALLLPGEHTAPVPASAPGTAKTSSPRVGQPTPQRPVTPVRGVPIQPPPAIGRAPTPSRITAAPRPQPQPQPDADTSTARQPPTNIRVDAPTVKLPKEALSPPDSGANYDLSLPGATPTELTALAEDIELGDTERRRVLAMARLADGDPHSLLGVQRGADAKTVKRAYFKLSKEIHPDRFYGRRLGSFAARMATVFEAVNRAYERLTAPPPARPARRPGTNSEEPQTPQEYAAELFDRACTLEVNGDLLGAMQLFAAAVRVEPHARYLRRAASCALAAAQPRTAVEYAKKAQAQMPDDPSSARLLAQAFRAAGKLGDAEEVLVMAMAMKSENDVLTGELRNDLAEVRRLLAAGA